DIIENVLRQLAQAEKAATDVEVHAIEFGSRQVNQLFTALKAGIPPVLQNAASQTEFLAQLTALKVQDQDRLENELKALWAGEKDDWVARKRDALALLERIGSEANQASDFLRHGFQPELVAADVIVPALKAMGGTTAPRELKLLEEYAAKGIEHIQN